MNATRSCTHILVAVLLMLATAGCARITPLYRDYETEHDDVTERIQRALAASGWELDAAPVPGMLATQPRTFRSWGLYRVELSLEIAPLAGNFVRILIHPYRRYFTGMRSKVPYLRVGLAKSALTDLNKALRQEGLISAGSAQDRDRASRKR